MCSFSWDSLTSHCFSDEHEEIRELEGIAYNPVYFDSSAEVLMAENIHCSPFEARGGLKKFACFGDVEDTQEVWLAI